MNLTQKAGFHAGYAALGDVSWRLAAFRKMAEDSADPLADTIQEQRGPINQAPVDNKPQPVTPAQPRPEAPASTQAQGGAGKTAPAMPGTTTGAAATPATGAAATDPAVKTAPDTKKSADAPAPAGKSWLDNNGEWVSQVGGGLLSYWLLKQSMGGTVLPAGLALYIYLALQKNKFNLFGGEQKAGTATTSETLASESAAANKASKAKADQLEADGKHEAAVAERRKNLDASADRKRDATMTGWGNIKTDKYADKTEVAADGKQNIVSADAQRNSDIKLTRQNYPKLMSDYEDIVAKGGNMSELDANPTVKFVKDNIPHLYNATLGRSMGEPNASYTTATGALAVKGRPRESTRAVREGLESGGIVNPDISGVRDESGLGLWLKRNVSRPIIQGLDPNTYGMNVGGFSGWYNSPRYPATYEEQARGGK